MPTAPLTALRWPAGVLLTSWTYLWRTTPMHRRELAGEWDRDAPPPLPADRSHDGIQAPQDGAGAYLHRRYRVRVKHPRMDAAELIARVSADPNRVAPGQLARFHKTRGADGRMAVGDEWLVRMPGPWDGPVRVVELAPDHFRFATLDGHLEAGQIEWRAEPDGDALVFTITSWARPGDRVSDLLHNRLRMAKEVQLHMWTSVLERVARLAGEGHDAGLDIETHVVAADALPARIVRA